MLYSEGESVGIGVGSACLGTGWAEDGAGLCDFNDAVQTNGVVAVFAAIFGFQYVLLQAKPALLVT